ncbi:hypothetical protein D3C76_1520770 [compost metagenome]
MEKRTYYVSVQGRSLLDNQDEASYEWVIHATESEADTISHMLEQIGETEDSEFLAFTYPWPDTPEEWVNANYSSLMNDLYHEIYRLGSEETKQQVRAILERS